jgi:tetratricopeptide (TPR) repeat protein
MAYEKPTLFESSIYQGQSLLKQKKFTEAINSFNKAIEIQPNFAVIYLWRGDSYAQQHNLIPEILDYTKAALIYIVNPNRYRCIRD